MIPAAAVCAATGDVSSDIQIAMTMVATHAANRSRP
jgi:hypothetical protein